MTNINMASVNMANMNTLIRKGYLLAGVMMAANMFIVNEVRAMDSEMLDNKDDSNNIPTVEINQEKQSNEEIKEGKNNIIPSAKQAGPIATLLGKKDVINLVGTFAVSCLNNYFNLWDYKSGKYLDWKFGFFGWRTKRFLNDYLQFEVNLNVYRGLGWGILNMVNYKNQNKISMQLIFRFVTGFISAPLTLHIFNFSIAISIDSILYGVVEVISNRWGENKKAEVKEENEEDLLTNLKNEKDIEDKKEEEKQVEINKLNLSENGETNKTNNNENGANFKGKKTDDDE